MQFKLLQFYKVLSNFATTLISAFVPLLVFQLTGNFYLALSYFVVKSVVSYFLNTILRKYLYKYAQLFLMLRLIPIILTQGCLVFVTKMPIAATILCGVFSGIDSTFNSVPSEVIFNYSTPPNVKSSTIAIGTLAEEFGLVLAGILGGLFLDKLDYTYLIIISLSLYFISSLPLLIYFIKNRKQKLFNIEVTSNAAMYYENQVENKKGKIVCKKIKRYYFLQYALMTALDVGTGLFGLGIYMKMGSFFLSGTLDSIFDGLYSLSTIVVAKLDEKIDLTIAAAVAIVVMNGCLIGIGFTIGSVTSFVLYEIIAAIWPLQTIFVYQRMISKSRVLGISNDMMFYRMNGLKAGQIFYYTIGLIAGAILPIYLVVGIFGMYSGIRLPFKEEHTRRELVDYLENNTTIKRENFFKRMFKHK